MIPFLKSFVFYFFSLLLFGGCIDHAQQTKTFKHTNSLVGETSPYLLKHAHNPVDWQPWNDSIFDQAKLENKLIIISIGYSSCHWCSVMEEETFSDDSIADFMNANFVNVKVDREERPDIDQLYMTALQLMNGSGGWPLNIIVLPNGQPLYGGTYHTKENWLSSLKLIDSLYKKDPINANNYARQVTARIKELNQYAIRNTLTSNYSPEVFNELISKWQLKWDFYNGGIQGSQKFMLPVNLNFLLDHGILTKDQNILDFVELTLDQIMSKGVNDHIDGGFYRYSTDKHWITPHFEKMLYDNAQMVSVYAKAYQYFRKPQYKDVLEQTLNFLTTKLKTQEDVFQSSIDAETDGIEGLYYTITDDQIKKYVTIRPDLFMDYFQINNQKRNGSIRFHLYQDQPDSLFIVRHKMELRKLTELKDQWRQNILKLRAQNEQPAKDDKIIISWNALTIEAFVDAYLASKNQHYLQQAESTFKTLMRTAYFNEDLIHSYKKNSSKIRGFLDDYSFMIAACLKLYKATGSQEYAVQALHLTNRVNEIFSSADSPFFKYSSSDELIAPIIKTNDDVLPSGNSVMAHNLFILSHLFYQDEFEHQAKKMLEGMNEHIISEPGSYPLWLSLYQNHVYPYYDIAISGENSENLSFEMYNLNIPNSLIVFNNTQNEVPIFEDRWQPKETLIYICEQRSCKFPVKTISEAKSLMNF